MKTFFYFIVLAIAVNLAGCCSSSRVILLESTKGDSAIVVKTLEGELVLDKSNTYTELSSATAKPAVAKEISLQELEAKYGSLIAAAPKTPISFLFYFEPGSISLTETAKKQFPEIENAIRERVPCDVNIIGHSDRMGSKSYNIDLSLRRARRVHAWLVKLNLDISNIVVESYGEEDPLVQTADGVAAPRNRRVEILVR